MAANIIRDMRPQYEAATINPSRAALKKGFWAIFTPEFAQAVGADADLTYPPTFD